MQEDEWGNNQEKDHSLSDSGSVLSQAPLQVKSRCDLFSFPLLVPDGKRQVTPLSVEEAHYK